MDTTPITMAVTDTTPTDEYTLHLRNSVIVYILRLFVPVVQIVAPPDAPPEEEPLPLSTASPHPTQAAPVSTTTTVLPLLIMALLVTAIAALLLLQLRQHRQLSQMAKANQKLGNDKIAYDNALASQAGTVIYTEKALAEQTEQTQDALALFQLSQQAQQLQQAQLEMQAALILKLEALGDPMMGMPHMLLQS